MISHTLQLIWQRLEGDTPPNAPRGNGTILGIVANGTSEFNHTFLVPAAAANYALPVDLPAEYLVSLLIVSSEDIVMKTNSSSTPGETTPINKNMPYIWQGAVGTSPLAESVESVFFDNAGATDAVVEIRALASFPDPNAGL
jgi:hypothetical protein